MNNKAFIYSKIVISCLFYLAIPLFYYLFYRYHLLAFEEYQMFTFDAPALWQAVSYPGGISDYFGTFLTSFFHFPAGGPLILGTLFFLCGICISYLLKKTQPHGCFFAPPLLTALLMTMLHFNLIVKLSSSLMFFITLLFSCIYVNIKPNLYRRICGAILLAAAYWIGIVSSLILLSVIVTWEWFTCHDRHKYSAIGCYLSIAIILPLIARIITIDYHPLTLSGAYLGHIFTYEKQVLYSRFLKIWSSPAVYMIFLFMLYKWRNSKKNQVPNNKFVFSMIMLQLCMLFITGYSVIKRYEAYKNDELFMKADYLVKTEKWDELIEFAHKELPASNLSSPYINLALASTEKLSQNITLYRNNTPDMMLVPFMQDYLTAKILCEILYQLGDIANAQHMAYESLVSTPGGRNVYMTQRLAQCALILEDYLVAEKYLKRLTYTPVYHTWASSYLEMIKHPDSLKEVEWIATKRKLLPKRNEILGFDNIVSVCIPLINAQPQNKLAFEYMATSFLITKDINNFYKLYHSFRPQIRPEHVPELHQQALLVYMNANRIGPENYGSVPISQKTQQHFEKFSNKVLQYQKAKKEPNDANFKREFGQTYWYYYMNQKQ